ncbi:fimbrillin family protein [Bacteroides thetaiotaomicron]|uniref:fimbrillin family protein n=1 Tax=Bacteroides thetaiotaomicron TaxID=818 RepID=UPI001CE28477|nr:fimbrillin family protein [Bacteroides thetaiotaomicron]MCA6029927.1 fimbrillin family protein [Bacteroides thetaiotaomicron]
MNARAFTRIAAAIVVALTAGSCADEGFDPAPAPGTATAAPPLTVTVTDGAYAPAPTADDEDDAPAPATRAVERGYATEFTAGDRIGLYEVKEVAGSNGFSRYQVSDKNLNLCLTYDGTAWTLPSGKELSPERPSANERTYYYAYYPYQDDSYMGNYVKLTDLWSNETGIPPTAREVFDNLISLWVPAIDQRTYAAYTANDLMVSLGTVARRTDGADGSVLSFVMEHQMGLAVIRVPAVKCTYTETVSGKAATKDYRLYTGMSVGKFWQENSHTARLLVRPGTMQIAIFGTYYTATFEKRKFEIHTVADSGIYRLYTIDGGTETVTERPLATGDFYMSDGSVLPREAADSETLPTDVQEDCLGVVFWVGEIEEMHWTQTGYKQGDHLLMRDHPECVHGMAVALRDASSTAVAWATGEGASERLYDWANGFSGFTPPEQADWEAIKASNSSYGYSCSRLTALYGSRHDGTTFPALDAIATYAAAHPAPAGSSGWFLPSMSELATLCFGAPENFGLSTSSYYYAQLRMLKEINPRIDKAAGNKLAGRYWSSYAADDGVWYVDVDAPNYNMEPKTDTYKVRAVLAF